MPEQSTHTRSVTVAEATIDLSWAGVTHTGRRREINQDALLASYPLFIVADGMGGHIGGEIASASTVDRLARMVEAGIGDAEDHREGAVARRPRHRLAPRDDGRRHRHDPDRCVSRPERRTAAVGDAQHRRFARLPHARRHDRADHDRSLGRAGTDGRRAPEPRRGREPPVRQRDHARRRARARASHRTTCVSTSWTGTAS